jgi:hypothetical protein
LDQGLHPNFLVSRDLEILLACPVDTLFAVIFGKCFPLNVSAEMESDNSVTQRHDKSDETHYTVVALVRAFARIRSVHNQARSLTYLEIA